MKDCRVLSGMRPTGLLHLGHYHGVLKNWIALQEKYESYFFVADWHALTTNSANKINLQEHTYNMVIDWLASGINPNTSTIFIQSRVLEHAELHLLLSMITPISWLERAPSYKDQQLKLINKDLLNYGFLGYPLLQSADILMYGANLVPVGDDQVAHIEITREIARRFNYIYGREDCFVEKAENAINKMGSKKANLYRDLRKNYQEKGDKEALHKAKALLEEQQNITLGERERLLGYIDGVVKTILLEPKALLTKVSKLPGIDGRKMSKSYNNIISLRDDKKEVELKIKKMPTDPARVKISDPGDPKKCPVWQLHEVYSSANTKEFIIDSCKNAKIGCIECKKPLIDSINEELEPIQEKIKEYQSKSKYVQEVIFSGCDKARSVAKKTMEDVRDAMGIINYQ